MSSINEKQQQIATLSTLADLERVRHDIVNSLDRYAKSLEELYCMFEGLNLYLYRLEKNTRFHDGTVDYDGLLKSVDQKLWDFAISTSGVSAVLSSEGEQELRKRYQDEPVPFTEEEANKVIKRLAESTPMLAASTLRSIFEKLTSTRFRRGNGWRVPKENRSHDKIRKSFRFSHFPEFRSWSYSIEEQYLALFNDLELVCRMINHLPKLKYPDRLGDRMNHRRWAEVSFPNEFSTDHFTVRVFKCGNVKIDFTCEQTLGLLNRYGADGKALVDPRGDAPHS